MVTLFLCFMIEQTTMYFIYPKATKITVKEDVPLVFTSVTVCNLNMYKYEEDLFYIQRSSTNLQEHLITTLE